MVGGGSVLREPVGKSQMRSLPRLLRGRASQAWQYRWSAILSCATARAFALSLLDRRAVLGCDGDTPTSLTLLPLAAICLTCRESGPL